MAEAKSMEARVSSLEESRDEWNSSLRVRCKGFTHLAARCKELQGTTREFWRVKCELFELFTHTFAPILVSLFPNGADAKVKGELNEVFGQSEAFLGIFPVGGRWGEEKAIDIRFKPGLIALRANTLVKNFLTPEMKKAGAGEVELWVPLSAPEIGAKDQTQSVWNFRRPHWTCPALRALTV